MLHRHAIADEQWERIKDLLPGQRGRHGRVAKDNRLFIDAMQYIARIGIPSNDLPARFGQWNSVWLRFDRWAAKGRWDPILAALRDRDLDMLILDSTAVCAHPCVAGVEKMRLAAKAVRRWAAAGAGSGPRSLGVATASAIPSSCS